MTGVNDNVVFDDLTYQVNSHRTNGSQFVFVNDPEACQLLLDYGFTMMHYDVASGRYVFLNDGNKCCFDMISMPIVCTNTLYF